MNKDLDEIIRHEDVLKPQLMHNGTDSFIRILDINKIIEGLYNSKASTDESKKQLSLLFNFLDKYS